MSLSPLEALIKPLLNDIWLFNITKYVGVMSITFLVLEVLSTMEEEVHMSVLLEATTLTYPVSQISYIWPSRWTVMKSIYLVNRYSPFIDTSLSLSAYLGTSQRESCSLRFEILAYVYAVGVYFSEFILVARTLALYEFSPHICVAMGLLMIGLIVPSLFMLHTYLGSLDYSNTAILEFIGCAPSDETEPAWTLSACILVSETVVVLLTVVKRLQTSSKESARSPLVRTMYRDGSLNYVIMLVLTVANLCTMLFAPKAAQSLLQMPLRVIHSALCSRVLLNLRKAADRYATATLANSALRSQLNFEPSPLPTRMGEVAGRESTSASAGRGGRRRTLPTSLTQIELAVELETITMVDFGGFDVEGRDAGHGRTLDGDATASRR
ncbi:hypothetical protein C8Q76DRAFT_166308 [Earliella scabrosa]|nr:hypothetical protein C8Q76DRAFT_166308 [Earliella scabrosa]